LVKRNKRILYYGMVMHQVERLEEELVLQHVEQITDTLAIIKIETIILL